MEVTPISISYATMREAGKKATDILSYNDLFMLSACSMFEYVHEGTDDPFEEIKTNFIELYLTCLGNAAVIDTKEFLTAGTNTPYQGIIVCRAERAGSPNPNGLGRDLICTTEDGRVVTIKDFETEGKDKVVYFRNNAYAFPDFTIGESGDILAEIQKSKRHNIINSRLTPIVIAKDAKAKTAIEKALKENNAGSYAVVLSDNITSEGEEFVLNVTDVANQDKIQYLNHAYDDEFRHWYNLHGLDITGASKQAQQTEAEVSSGVNSRKILPFAMLAERKAAVKRMNTLYGFDCEVRFSKPWRDEFESGLVTPNMAQEGGENPEGDNLPAEEESAEIGANNEESEGGDEE